MIYITYVRAHRWGGHEGFEQAEKFCGKRYSCSIVDREDLRVCHNNFVVGIAPGYGSWLVKDLTGKITVWNDEDFKKYFKSYYKD